MSDKLSDCPFCESADVEYRFIALHWVKCNSCGAEGPGKTNKRAAIAAWNRRASPAPAIPAGLSDQQILDIAKRVTPAFRESPASCIALVREALKAAPAISESEELVALREMLDDARTEFSVVRMALGVEYEPHQTVFERTLDAARAGGKS